MDRIEANRAHSRVSKITKRAYVYTVEKDVIEPNQKIFHTPFTHNVLIKDVSISLPYVPDVISIFCIMQIEQEDGMGAKYNKIEVSPGDNVMPSIKANKGDTMSFVFSTLEEVDTFKLHDVIIAYTVEQ